MQSVRRGHVPRRVWQDRLQGVHQRQLLWSRGGRRAAVQSRHLLEHARPAVEGGVHRLPNRQLMLDGLD